jgi:hypothetical protein
LEKVGNLLNWMKATFARKIMENHAKKIIWSKSKVIPTYSNHKLSRTTHPI